MSTQALLEAKMAHVTAAIAARQLGLRMNGS